MNGGPNIGALCAVPFLFSLVAFAGAIYAGSLVEDVISRFALDYDALSHELEELDAAHEDLVLAVARLRELRRKQAEASGRRDTLQSELDELLPYEEDIARLREELERLESEIAELLGGEGELAALRQRIRDALAEKETLAVASAELEDRAQELSDLEDRVAGLRSTRAEREARLAELRSRLAELDREMGEAMRVIDEADQVGATDLVPSGSRRRAAFFECVRDGVLRMPEAELLARSAPESARDAFTAAARETGYVVFLIHSDGFSSFARYRDVLEDYNRAHRPALDYGFEPIDADWTIVYPARQPAGDESAGGGE